MDAETHNVLDEVRGRVLACIGDAEGQKAVERGRVLTLSAGQVAALDEARELLDALLVAAPEGATQ